jgi:hypothetical protein
VSLHHGAVGLFKEGGVPPVVSNWAREPESEFRIFVARIREMAGGEGDMRIFPRRTTPAPRDRERASF